MPRPMLPHDDLYATLELPVTASAEAIEIAWRALLKRHHPDVAGAAADPVAKRINVAHDWLSDPDLRARYDSERHPRRSLRRPPPPTGSRATSHRPRRPQRPRRPPDPAEALARHVERVARLSRDELDRLSLAESPTIAFVATIARFLSPDRLAAVEALEERVTAALPRSARWDAATRDAVVAYAQELVLGPFLDEHLSEPFRERIRERLARGWEAAVDQPRYGPNTAAVTAGLEHLRAMTPGALAQLAAGAATAGAVPADKPWPSGLTPHDDDALRVSSALAQRDALALLPDPVPAIARRSLGRAMHALVLRHAFGAKRTAELAGPWADILDVRAPVRVERRRA